jgi:predicted ATPase
LRGRGPDERDAARFVAQYDSRSHGESFMDVFAKRVRPGGLVAYPELEHVVVTRDFLNDPRSFLRRR